jgi:cbb3-type cytochrome oxidase subunit 3
MALEDSLAIYAEPEYNPRGVIGFNIAGAFYALFIVIMLIPFFIGIVMIAIYRYKKGKYDKQNREAILNNP